MNVEQHRPTNMVCLTDVITRLQSVYSRLQDTAGTAHQLNMQVGGHVSFDKGQSAGLPVSPVEPPIVDRLYQLAIKLEDELADLTRQLNAVAERVA